MTGILFVCVRTSVSLCMSRVVSVFALSRAPINNLGWHPTDSALFIASCRDDTISIWDVSVERDETTTDVEQKYGLEDLPPQLLFLHQGQKEVAEAHWHPMIPSAAFSAAADGFNIWRPSNL